MLGNPVTTEDCKHNTSAQSRGMQKNYRPITLTSHLIKLFEKVLWRSIVEYMERHDLLNPSKHGFRDGRSCPSQLIAHYDHILEPMENGDCVGVIYWTLCKSVRQGQLHGCTQKSQLLGYLRKYRTTDLQFSYPQNAICTGE